MGNFIEMSGMRFGSLVVIGFADKSPSGALRWNCKCDCGNESKAFGGGLRSGRIKSCGCSQVKRMREMGKAKRKHGMSHSKEESAWRHAHDRCSNKKNAQYKNYGGRGIKVCDRWASFEAFLSDMGAAPSPMHSLDRIDSNKNYDPGNCRWATWKDQQRNRRNNRLVEIGGVTKPLAAWCEETGVPYQRAHARLRLGWSNDRAVGMVK